MSQGWQWLAAVLVVLVSAPLALAAPTAEQRAEILAIGTVITKAGNLYKDGKYKEAAEAIKDAQSRVEKLAEGADNQLVTQLASAHKRLTNAHALLELEGVSLPELKPLEAKPKASDPAGGAGSVSFVKHVAPILNARCGGCHVRNARGMFSMATYEVLMTGPPAGKVVFPGNVPGSDLVVKVQDKEMPPNGAGIPDTELATLKKWVEEGAKFDGPDPKAQLTTFVTGAGQPAATPMIAVQMATGKESVSFSKDIAPLFVGTCTGCHGGNNPRGNLSLLTVESMFRGGDRGEPILPGKPADSLLIKKLKGTADGARMPMGRTPLEDAAIAKIEKWIEEGAKFDGPNTRQPIEEVAAIAKARGQTHDELAADRAKLADSNWRLAMAGVQPGRIESTNFIVMGNVMENVLNDIAQQAEVKAPKVAAIFKAPPDQPLVKGRMTLFVLGERYDYGEFGKMLEKRDLPPTWRGHHRYTVVDAYAAIFPSRNNEFSNEALVTQQIGALYVASLGSGVPRWFSEGTGRVVASRLAPNDPRVRAWDDDLKRVLPTMTAADDFMTGKLPPEESDIASYSFVKFLMADARKHNLLIDGLRKGGDFSKVFLEVYGAGPAQAAQAWARARK
jgi:mono/diheme cytochrome c family protein